MRHLALTALLTAIVPGMIVPASPHVGDRVFPVYRIPDQVPIDVTDGSIEDWLDAGIPPSATALDFVTTGGGIYNPADVDFRLWFGWLPQPTKLYIAMERLDDEYVNHFDPSFEGWGFEGNFSWDGSLNVAIDGDHSGGMFIDYSVPFEDRPRTWFEGAQEYMAQAEVFGAAPIRMLAWGATRHYFVSPPYADAGGAVYEGNPVGTVTELYVTPFDRFVWNSAEESDISSWNEGKVIGLYFEITEVDWDSPEGDFSNWTYFFPAGSLETVVVDADFFLDGVLVDRTRGMDDTARRAKTWGRIKASLSE